MTSPNLQLMPCKASGAILANRAIQSNGVDSSTQLLKAKQYNTNNADGVMGVAPYSISDTAEGVIITHGITEIAADANSNVIVDTSAGTWEVAGGAIAEGDALAISSAGKAAKVNTSSPPRSGMWNLIHCVGYAIEGLSSGTGNIKIMVCPFSMTYGNREP